ncbi:hypothetical protein DSO57_1018450 [Entomophthora muscae]|uniref:Uncharacterized protein n=1 Tax=Entomophthora muscae TaxID=34485 RepID=A0ACC2RIU6_9FUNG|nr:hypothetical protein DSO57_1018450 [Entomophthora muscae]
MDEVKDPQELAEPSPPKLDLISQAINLVADESNGIVGDILRFSLLFGVLALFGHVKDTFYLVYRCGSPFASEGDLSLGKCARVSQLESCRKVVVHHSSQLAFALCGPGETYYRSRFPILDIWNYPNHAGKENSKLYTYNLKLQTAFLQELEGDLSGLVLNFNSLGVSQEKVDGKVLLSIGSTQDQSTEAVFLLEYDLEKSQVALLRTLIFHDLGLVERVMPISNDSYYIAFSPNPLGWRGKLSSIAYSKEGVTMLCDDLGCSIISTNAGASGLAVNAKGEKMYLAGRYSTDISVGLHNIARNPFEQALPTGLALINLGWDPASDSGFVIGTPKPFPLNFGARAGLSIQILLFKQKSIGIVNLNSGPPTYTTELIYHKHIADPFGDAYIDLSSKSLFLVSPFAGSRGLYTCNL